jgi:hypothetical protein
MIVVVVVVGDDFAFGGRLAVAGVVEVEEEEAAADNDDDDIDRHLVGSNFYRIHMNDDEDRNNWLDVHLNSCKIDCCYARCCVRTCMADDDCCVDSLHRIDDGGEYRCSLVLAPDYRLANNMDDEHLSMAMADSDGDCDVYIQDSNPFCL